ncbi:MAG TPA: hypothetical protein VGK73_12660 [Polyangiaceae bacterium]
MKGMVQALGATYRVVRVAAGTYEVVRILDDTLVGTFQTVPHLAVLSTKLEVPVMHAIIRAAVHGAKTSWVGRLTPA